MTIIPDIIDEQDVADLLDRKGEIRRRADKDPAAEIHLNGEAMASSLHIWLTQSAPMAAEQEHPLTLELANYAQQLQAHHLDILDRLQPA